MGGTTYGSNEHGRKHFRRRVGGWLFGSVLLSYLSSSAQDLQVKVLSFTL